MLIRSPRAVRFGSLTIPNVDLVALERTAHRLIEDWSDAGPHAVLVDVAAERIALRLERTLGPGESVLAEEFKPGYLGTLSLFFAPGEALGDAQLAELSISCVVTGVRYALDSRPIRQVLTMLAQSEDPSGAPVVVTTSSRIPGA